jgi:hypothetical protein
LALPKLTFFLSQLGLLLFFYLETLEKSFRVVYK